MARCIRPLAVVIALTSLALASPVALAGDWYVDIQDADCSSGSGGPDDPFCNIADGIAAASSGDTVHIAPGTYFENLVVDKDLTLIGTDGAGLTIVDGSQLDRVLLLTGEAVLDVHGLTFTEGIAEFGGGIYVQGDCTLTLFECTVSDNSAWHGGGIHHHAIATTLRLERSSVMANRAENEGGGLWAFGGTVELVDSQVEGNVCGDLTEQLGAQGGGVFLQDGTLLVERSSVNRNVVEGNQTVEGGGIYAESTVTVSQSSILDNHAVAPNAMGGGIYAFDTLALIDSVIRGNEANGVSWASGGAVESWGRLEARNCSFESNHATGGFKFGGAVANRAGDAAIEFCTFRSFFPDAVAGSQIDATEVRNTIVWNRIRHSFCEPVDVEYSDVEGGWPGTGNLDADPLFVDAENGDLRLAPGSPCIDAGDPAREANGLDLSGNPRWLDGSLDRAMRVDMGAFEFDHVHLDVSGTPTWGGTLTLDTSGTAGMAVFLFYGVAPAEIVLPPYGAVFFDLSAWWDFLFLGTIPDHRDVPIPPGSGSLDVILQELAVSGKPGNFSNPVTITIE